MEILTKFFILWLYCPIFWFGFLILSEDGGGNEENEFSSQDDMCCKLCEQTAKSVSNSQICTKF